MSIPNVETDQNNPKGRIFTVPCGHIVEARRYMDNAKDLGYSYPRATIRELLKAVDELMEDYEQQRDVRL